VDEGPEVLEGVEVEGLFFEEVKGGGGEGGITGGGVFADVGGGFFGIRIGVEEFAERCGCCSGQWS
jgi:hypothetical protein